MLPIPYVYTIFKTKPFTIPEYDRAGENRKDLDKLDTF